jgi:hypothetical protein
MKYYFTFEVVCMCVWHQMNVILAINACGIQITLILNMASQRSATTVTMSLNA